MYWDIIIFSIQLDIHLYIYVLFKKYLKLNIIYPMFFARILQDKINKQISNHNLYTLKYNFLLI